MQFSCPIVIEILENVMIIFSRVRWLEMSTTSDQEHIWGIHLIKKTHCLTCVYEKENFFVFTLHIHFLVHFGEIFGGKDLCVLDFEEIVSTVTIEIDEKLWILVCFKFFGFGEL